MAGGWFYNDLSGVVRYDSGLSYYADLTARALGVGWHGPYKTEALAATHAGVKGATATTNTNPVTAATTGATSGITGFLHGLSQSATWARVLKVIIGGALVLMGVKALTGIKTPEVIPL